MQISAVEGNKLYGSLAGAVDNHTVWMSHGNEAVRLPEGFKVTQSHYPHKLEGKELLGATQTLITTHTSRVQGR
ncbi:hypothetical protein M758_UG341100 [Ceratodon purpureus]|nr:hypothetical protein M758_UG341100 [Ceratodon purpureus]